MQGKTIAPPSKVDRNQSPLNINELKLTAGYYAAPSDLITHIAVKSPSCGAFYRPNIMVNSDYTVLTLQVMRLLECYKLWSLCNISHYSDVNIQQVK